MYIYMHIYVGVCIMKYYSAIRKNEKNETWSFATTWMDLEGIMLNEINQKEKDKYYILSLIGGI